MWSACKGSLLLRGLKAMCHEPHGGAAASGCAAHYWLVWYVRQSSTIYCGPCMASKHLNNTRVMMAAACPDMRSSHLMPVRMGRLHSGEPAGCRQLYAYRSAATQQRYLQPFLWQANFQLRGDGLI